MNSHGPLLRRCNARKSPSLVCRSHAHLLIARLNAPHIGLDPDLEEMRHLPGGMVELAVLHPPARTHALHIARRNALHVAHAVTVRQFTGEHVADDFHVTVPVGAKPGARRDAVLVDHPQVAPPHVVRVVVAGEGKTVERLEPAVVRVAAILGTSEGDHANLLNKSERQQA